MRIHSFRAGIANVHLIDDGRGVVIVDAGWQGSARRILSRVRMLGYAPRQVRLILLTHVHIDHAGSAGELRRQTGAPIAVHRGDARNALTGQHRIPTGRGWAGTGSKWLADRLNLTLAFDAFTPDVWLEEGQTLLDFGLEGYVIHTPGHTAGSVTLALEYGIAIIGDALINMFKVGLPLYWEDPAAGRESAKKIQSLKPRVLYSGHGRVFSGSELDNYMARRAAKKGELG
jgi:glyoxylase-like metal-dependent hydrolase (beta-lactamase superfamily II)